MKKYIYIIYIYKTHNIYLRHFHRVDAMQILFYVQRHDQ